MNEATLEAHQGDEATLIIEISDAALEASASAGAIGPGAVNPTLAYNSYCFTCYSEGRLAA
jgi:hypothetical protein